MRGITLVAVNGALATGMAWLCLFAGSPLGGLAELLPAPLLGLAVPLTGLSGVIVSVAVWKWWAVPTLAGRSRDIGRWLWLALVFPVATGIVASWLAMVMFLTTSAQPPYNLAAASAGSVLFAPVATALAFEECWPVLLGGGVAVAGIDWLIVHKRSPR